MLICALRTGEEADALVDECDRCGREVNVRPHEPALFVGGRDVYEVVCLDCWETKTARR